MARVQEIPGEAENLLDGGVASIYPRENVTSVRDMKKQTGFTLVELMVVAPDDGDSVLEDGEDVLLKQCKEISNKYDIYILAGVMNLTCIQTGGSTALSTVGMKIGADDSTAAISACRI